MRTNGTDRGTAEAGDDLTGRTWRALRYASGLVAFPLVWVLALTGSARGDTLIGWNNLGMHCMDADHALFELLPPFNTIHAQLIDEHGNLVRAENGIRVTYEAVADPDGSINSTSAGKTNFWEHVQSLFGASLPTDVGLFGKNMPGPGNVPQPMSFDAASAWWIAEGIPITPYDDAHRKNYYPMMRLVARDASGSVRASTDIVLPVSDEMDCKACHASESGPAARPKAGWAVDGDAERETRINILRLHDEMQADDPLYASALSELSYNPAGLLATALEDGKSVLCAGCHLSEALPNSGRTGIRALTRAMHGLHATVADPTNGLTLDASDNRSACYRCHPGSATRCLRGAMGAAVAADGAMAMQCQNCHGSMSDVAEPNRVGWLDEPTCQNCHTGDAVSNNGQIRYTSVFEAGEFRQAVNGRFATTADAPAPGLSLYRFSTGHGGVKCEGCHGSTHAEFPASHRNDNVQSVQLQGHKGMLVECTACHDAQPETVSGGPHGMHPVGPDWVDRHKDAVDSGGAAQCRACHGTDYRGTVLSRSQADRVLNTELGVKYFWRGFQIGCYACHVGPSSDTRNPNRPAVVSDASIATAADTPVSLELQASDVDGNPLTLRVVAQAEHGTVGLAGRTATYYPDPGFTGEDRFAFAAWDGSTDSNLGTVLVSVTGGEGQPSSTPTWTPIPTDTRVPTSTSSPTSMPTNTWVPTSTSSPMPTLTRTPTASETPTATLSPTKTRRPRRSSRLLLLHRSSRDR